MLNPVSALGPKLSRLELSQRDRDIVLFWAGKGAIFQGLAQAMQNHLGNIDIVFIDTLPRGEIEDRQVRLVLLRADRSVQLLDNIAACRAAFPGVTIGLVIDDISADMTPFEDLLDKEIVQGLLPLELKLEVFLAATSLMIIGGEYYPPSLSRRLRSLRSAVPTEIPQPAPPINIHLSRLTSREREVLALLSEGFQNKLIADRMDLSEHTVKVHVHNLINKLRVTNRTQAAAAYRSNVFYPAISQDSSDINVRGGSPK